jgi:hypothetical protein
MRNQFNNSQNTMNIDRNSDAYKCEIALKKVKRIKGFYIHLLVYIVVNIFIVYVNTKFQSETNKEFWRWQTFSTALFWGIGLLVNGLSVFGTDMFFGTDWEDKKIKQFMEKEKLEN